MRTPTASRIALGGPPVQGVGEGGAPESFGLLAAALILLLAFGSIVAAGLPLAVALFGLGLSGSLIGVLAAVVDVPDFAPAVAALIGIGVGVDYALLILTRFRTALDDKDTREAVIEAVETAGRSVLIAGMTVLISVNGLFLMGVGYLRGVALATSLSVLAVMAASVTLLPALLSFAGRRVDRLRIPGLGRSRRTPAATLGARRPAPPGARARGRRRGDGRRSSRRSRPCASASRTPATTPPARPPVSPTTWSRAASARAPTGRCCSPGRRKRSRHAERQRRRLHERRRFVSRAAVGPRCASSLRPRPRSQRRPPTSCIGCGDELPPGVMVGGTGGGARRPERARRRPPAAVHRRRASCVSFLLLLCAFRSPLIALKAGAMNLLSVGAAYGVIALFAQGGFFGGLIGVDTATPVAPFIPVMMFAILFGLSMDYEVFLLSRVREEYLRHGDTTRAVAEGLARTARVITAAAAIMVAVFLAFVTSGAVFLKLLGIGMATAILVDATIVRMVLVPSLMQLLGSANWWIPAWLDRALPAGRT